MDRPDVFDAVIVGAGIAGRSRPCAPLSSAPEAALANTIRQYNDAVEAGRAERLDPPRTSSRYRPHLLRQPPFYAVRLCAGITYTMGGLAIDGFGRVMNVENAAIPGLYAAGCATGGLEGGDFAAYIGGLTKSSAMAFRTANHIAARHSGDGNPDGGARRPDEAGRHMNN